MPAIFANEVAVDWLRKRLTPSKRQQERWVELASTVETVWEEFFDPALSRVERLRSAYTMDEIDLGKKIREMGDTFTCDEPLRINKPLALAWRRWELESKDTENIITSVFLRNFAHLPVSWMPLFAPSAQEYGTHFEPFGGLCTDIHRNIPPEGMFLTSRGVLGTDKAGMYESGMVKADFRTKALPLLLRAKPLHIVFDGFLWYINFDLPVSVNTDVEWEAESQYQLLFTTVGSRFDIPAISADGERALDASMLSYERDTARKIDIPFVNNKSAWRLDLFFPDGFGVLGFDGLLPLDTNMADFLDATEGYSTPLLLTLGECEGTYSLEARSGEMRGGYKENESAPTMVAVLDSKVTTVHIVDTEFSFEFVGQNIPVGLDSFVCDGMPSHWLPLDLPISNASEGVFSPFYTLYRENSARFTLTPYVYAQSTHHEAQRNLNVISAPCGIESPTRNSVKKWPLAATSASIPSSAQPLLFDQIPADFMPLDTYGGMYV